MNITSKTKKLLIIALIIAVVAGALVLYLFIQIQQQGITLKSQQTVLAEAELKQETYTRIKRIVTETEDKRAKLKTAFFTDQSDSLDFITYLEDDLAPRARVDLKTESLEALAVANNPNATDMKMQFSFSGAKADVVDFARLLEVLPYHSRIEKLTIVRKESNTWEGEVTVVIVVSTL